MHERHRPIGGLRLGPYHHLDVDERKHLVRRFGIDCDDVDSRSEVVIGDVGTERRVFEDSDPRGVEEKIGVGGESRGGGDEVWLDGKQARK